MDKLGIYVHIPFCVKKCYYCDFISYDNKNELIEDYIQALINEIKIKSEEFSNEEVSTIYIGGGTPSYIDSKYIIKIINTIKENYQVNIKNIEVTLEVNPGTVTKEKLTDYINCGINRISIGLQSTNNELLKQIGRIHTYEKFLETYNLAKETGFKNINVDLMLALPNQTIEQLEESVYKVIELQPGHISLYSLILEEGTKLFVDYEQGKLNLPSDEEERTMYWRTKKILEEAGYTHYEISNFAKDGYKSIHNVDCWEQKNYLGFGIAAHSYIENTRYSNIIETKQYIENIKNNKIKENKVIQEIQNTNSMQKEFIMLGLRKIEGIKVSDFKNKFIQNPIYLYRKEFNELVENELVIIEEDIIKLTNKGIDFANIVWEKFI